MGIVDGRRVTVVVEGSMAEVGCCWIWWTYGARERVGAVYTGVWFKVTRALPAVDCPCIRERLVVVFTAAVVGVGRPSYGTFR